MERIITKRTNKKKTIVIYWRWFHGHLHEYPQLNGIQVFVVYSRRTMYMHVCLFIYFLSSSSDRFTIQFVFIFDGMCSYFRLPSSSIQFMKLYIYFVWSRIPNKHETNNTQTHYGWMKVNWCHQQWPLI